MIIIKVNNVNNEFGGSALVLSRTVLAQSPRPVARWFDVLNVNNVIDLIMAMGFLE